MACSTSVTSVAAVLAPMLLAYAFALARATAETGAVAAAEGCSPRVLLNSGWVCGARRRVHNDTEFASFLGVPYAKQPLGQLRFQELQPVEPWDFILDATKEGPVCPQMDVFYGRLMQPQNTAFTEACIHANVHVPMYALHALPPPSGDRQAREIQPPYDTGVPDDDHTSKKTPSLPIFVFVHGGGFAFGSGDPDLYGPEYLVSQGVIVITFNYRLNVFGFLSMNNSYIPGNNGLRDIVTLLRWVQTNARAFGGNPDEVTLAGHSAGAACVHLLTVSKAAKGLFKRALLMSGTAIPTFYTTSPAYAQLVSNMFLNGLNINSSHPEEIYSQLIDMPLEKLMEVHNYIQDLFGITVFYPVVESTFPNFTTILDDDPEVLLATGHGKDVPLMVGFTDAECYGFLPRFEKLDILERIKEKPIIMASPHIIYRRPPKVALEIARRVYSRYFYGEPTMDQYVKSCTEGNFIYPAIKVAQMRAAVGGAPVYLYEFSYEGEFSVKKEVDKTNYTGAGHLEDVTYVFRANSVLGPDFKPSRNDEDMMNWMLHFVINFIRCSDPACNRERHPNFATPWPPFSNLDMRYQGINMPFYRTLELNSKQLDMVRFYDSLENRTS